MRIHTYLFPDYILSFSLFFDNHLHAKGFYVKMEIINCEIVQLNEYQCKANK